MEVRCLNGELRRSRYGLVTRFVTGSDVQCAETLMNPGFGERGRNRTYHLLIPNCDDLARAGPRACVYWNSSKTISGFDPKRNGGPQVPAPLEVKTSILPMRLRP